MENESTGAESAHFEIVPLRGGVNSLRSLDNRETFHPLVGPAIEAQSLHMNSQRIHQRSEGTSVFRVWDVGFGAAANALAAIEELRSCRAARTELHSFDLSTAPIAFALSHTAQLSYLRGYETVIRDLLTHGIVEISESLTWRLHLGDFRSTLKALRTHPPHSILYDPYSPTHNPQMWTLEHFQGLYQCLEPSTPTLLTNYTRSTAMRVSLLLAGFFVGRGCSIGEKAETTLAANRLDLLSEPLDETWLKRVRSSGNSAPLRDGAGYSQSPIGDRDFALLKTLPQFRQ